MPRSPGLDPPGEGGGAARRLHQFEQARGLQPSGPEPGEDDDRAEDESRDRAEDRDTDGDTDRDAGRQRDRQAPGAPDREDGDA